MWMSAIMTENLADPSSRPASANHPENAEEGSSMQTLHMIRRHAANEEVKLCALKDRYRVLQLEMRDINNSLARHGGRKNAPRGGTRRPSVIGRASDNTDTDDTSAKHYTASPYQKAYALPHEPGLRRHPQRHITRSMTPVNSVHDSGMLFRQSSASTRQMTIGDGHHPHAHSFNGGLYGNAPNDMMMMMTMISRESEVDVTAEENAEEEEEEEEELADGVASGVRSHIKSRSSGAGSRNTPLFNHEQGSMGSQAVSNDLMALLSPPLIQKRSRFGGRSIPGSSKLHERRGSLPLPVLDTAHATSSPVPYELQVAVPDTPLLELPDQFMQNGTDWQRLSGANSGGTVTSTVETLLNYEDLQIPPELLVQAPLTPETDRKFCLVDAYYHPAISTNDRTAAIESWTNKHT